MGKLWVFGDSFCAHNLNWVKDIGDKSGLTPILKSRSASSIFYTYKSILENERYFKSEDSIIVGITNYSRHLFNDNHFIIQEYIEGAETRFDLTNPEKDTHAMQAYGEFLKFLYNHEEERIKALPMVEVILNNFKNRLNVKNFIPFFTLNGEQDFQQYSYLDFKFDKYPSMWLFFANFIEAKLGISKLDIQKIVDITSTPNHWIDHPDWNNHFWGTYEELFKPIWNG